MTRYNFHEYERDEENKWIIIHAVSQLAESKFKELDPSDIEIRLLVNGNEIDFLKFVNIYISQVDDMAEKKAKAILKEQLSKCYDMLYDIEQYLEDKLERVKHD